MSEIIQFTTKNETSLKRDIETICKNLSPLIGCKINGVGWAPTTGVYMCKAINLAGQSCTNVARETVVTGELTHTFEPRVTLDTNEIWKLVRAYDSTVLNSSYVMYVMDKMPFRSSAEEKLHLTTRYCQYTDSTIFDGTYRNAKIELLPVYKQICLITLSCFVLRWHLYRYYTGVTNTLDMVEVSPETINLIVGNIDYVKSILSQDSSVDVDPIKSGLYIRRQLNTLRKNLVMVEPYVLRYIR